jgi:hypothetical protein
MCRRLYSLPLGPWIALTCGPSDSSVLSALPSISRHIALYLWLEAAALEVPLNQWTARGESTAWRQALRDFPIEGLVVSAMTDALISTDRMMTFLFIWPS